MGLTKAQERMVLSTLDGWKKSPRPENPVEAATKIVKALGAIVTTYAYGHDEIEILLQEAFVTLFLSAKDLGWEQGKEFERNTNIAIRSAGACVKTARDAERKALRETLRTVFDAECERGTNAFYAFNEALKAIE